VKWRYTWGWVKTNVGEAMANVDVMRVRTRFVDELEAHCHELLERRHRVGHFKRRFGRFVGSMGRAADTEWVDQ
jgi:hypothetical protein